MYLPCETGCNSLSAGAKSVVPSPIWEQWRLTVRHGNLGQITGEKWAHSSISFMHPPSSQQSAAWFLMKLSCMNLTLLIRLSMASWRRELSSLSEWHGNKHKKVPEHIVCWCTQERILQANHFGALVEGHFIHFCQMEPCMEKRWNSALLGHLILISFGHLPEIYGANILAMYDKNISTLLHVPFLQSTAMWNLGFTAYYFFNFFI